jgi:uncharacterized membrane protein (DUF373 family)
MAARHPVREGIAHAYTLIEDIVYVGLGLLLAAIVLTLLVLGIVDFARGLASLSIGHGLIGLLDRILLILLIVELLYTVQVSFREHALAPAPFLLVGLISAIRRVLLVTAQLGEQKPAEGVSQSFLIELGVLTALIVGLAVALYLVKKGGGEAVAQRA